MKGPDALTYLRKEKKETLRDYSLRYWQIFQEAEDCDMEFPISTFKYGLPWDRDGIYNDLTRRTPKNFDYFLSRIYEFARVEDDDLVANRVEYKREIKRINARKYKGSSKKNKIEKKGDG